MKARKYIIDDVITILNRYYSNKKQFLVEVEKRMRLKFTNNETYRQILEDMTTRGKEKDFCFRMLFSFRRHSDKLGPNESDTYEEMSKLHFIERVLKFYPINDLNRILEQLPKRSVTSYGQKHNAQNCSPFVDWPNMFLDLCQFLT